MYTLNHWALLISLNWHYSSYLYQEQEHLIIQR